MARINYNMSMRSIQILDDTFDKKEFNDIALHPLQAWEWGEARKKMGIKVVRVGVFDKNILVETYQMTIHSVGLGYKIGYLPRSTFPSADVLSFLSAYGQKNNLIFVKIEPYILNNQFPISN